MSTRIRLTKLESRIQPWHDSRPPLLVRFIDINKPSTGILYVFSGDKVDSRKLDATQMAEYDAANSLTGVNM